MNRKNNRTFRGFMKKNGFYVAMVMFVVAGAIASYAAVMSIIGAGAPTIDDPNAELVQSEPEKPVVIDPAPTVPEPATPDVPDRHAEQASADVYEPLAPVHVRPVAGAVAKAFSGTELVKSMTMNDWRTHNGVDYTAALGEPVTAVFSGEITRAEKDPLLGNLIELKLDSGYHVLYANLAAFNTVEVGQRVSQGDVIGTVGNTALIESAELPHLHLEVRSGDKRIDPETIF